MENEKKIIVISGPSGVGKTTMYKQLLQEYQKDLSFSISATTREKRDEEVNGRDYHFLSKEEFERLITEDEFVEWEKVHSNYYGTLKSEVYRIWEEGKHCLLDIDVKGGLGLQKIFGQKAFLIFVSPPSVQALEQRLRSRGANDEDSLRQRLHNATKEMEQKHFYDYVLQNEDIDQAILSLKKIIQEKFLFPK